LQGILIFIFPPHGGELPTKVDEQIAAVSLNFKELKFLGPLFLEALALLVSVFVLLNLLKSGLPTKNPNQKKPGWEVFFSLIFYFWHVLN
jgi:hypothetical protein